MEHLRSRAGANGDRARMGGPANRCAHALSASRHASTVAAINGTIDELNGAGSTSGRSVAAPTAGEANRSRHDHDARRPPIGD